MMKERAGGRVKRAGIFSLEIDFRIIMRVTAATDRILVCGHFEVLRFAVFE